MTVGLGLGLEDGSDHFGTLHLSSLALLVLGVTGTHHSAHALADDNAAVGAYAAAGRTNFHEGLPGVETEEPDGVEDGLPGGTGRNR